MSYSNDAKTVAIYDLGAGGINLAGDAEWDLTPNGDGTFRAAASVDHLSRFGAGNWCVEREITITSGPGTVLELGGWGETEAVNIQLMIGWDADRRIVVGWERDAGIDYALFASEPLPAGAQVRLAVSFLLGRLIIVANGVKIGDHPMPRPTGGGTVSAPTPGMTLAVGYRVSTADPQKYTGGGWLRISQARTLEEIQAEWKALHPPAAPDRSDEWFLVARLTVGGVSSYYGEIDRVTGGTQIDGEILSARIGGRAFHPDRKLPRSVSSLVLRNFDKSKNRLFRDLSDPTNSMTRARVRFFTGRPGESFADWQPISGDYFVERVNSITSQSVDLTLVDRLTDSLGSVIRVPTLGELADAVNALMPGGNGWAAISDTRYNEQLPISFGQGWHRAIPLQDGEPIPGTRTAAGNVDVWQWLLGISLKPWHPSISGGAWQVCRTNARTQELEQLLPARVGENVITGYVAVDGRTWHIAYLRVEGLQYLADVWAQGGTFPGTAVTIRTEQNAKLMWLYENPGDVWTRLPYGAENADFHDPAHIVEEITTHYSDTPIPLDLDSITEVRRALRGRSVGGTIYGGQQLDEIIGAICASWNIDPAIRSDGTLMLRSSGVTTEDLTLRIPSALAVTDQFDVVENSYRITVPQGNERWGIATRVRLNGVPEYAHGVYRQEMQLFGGDSRLGRRILKDVDVAWHPLAPDGHPGALFLNEHSEQHTIVTCCIPWSAEAVALELGDCIRLTHFAGIEDTGDNLKLYRVEGIEPLWSERQFRLTLRDLSELDTMQPWVLDDEANWLRTDSEATGAEAVVDSGQQVIVGGVDLGSLGVAPGDIFWCNEGEEKTQLALRIREVSAEKLIVDPYEASFATVVDWKILRSYDTAPDNTSHPGEYDGLDSANDLYGSLCDEALMASDGRMGAMEDLGAPGYEIYTE